MALFCVEVQRIMKVFYSVIKNVLWIRAYQNNQQRGPTRGRLARTGTANKKSPRPGASIEPASVLSRTT